MGLFDFNANEQRQRLRAQQTAQDFAYGQLRPGAGPAVALAQAGRQLGQAFSGGNPEQQRIQKMEMVQNKVLSSGVQFGTPEFFDLAANELAAAGLTQEALQAKIEGQKYLQGQEDRTLKRRSTEADILSKLNKDTRGATKKKYDDLADIYGEEKAKQMIAQESAGTTSIKVQSSKILPGGLTQITFSDGTTVLRELNDEQRKKVRDAEERGAELQGLRAQNRVIGAGAARQSEKAFEKLPGIDEKISLLNTGITLIGNGAKVGTVYSLLPSVTAASKELDNVQAQLGLNVIQNTTFGSLSEQELKFALKTALPQNLGPEELKDWMIRKRDAQMKLRAYIEEAARYLGTPGNTIAGFLDMKRSSNTEKPDAPKSNNVEDLLEFYSGK